MPTTNFPYYLRGRGLRRLEGAGIELSNVQLVHKFAATLSNTMIHKQFKNDKKGFWQIGPLAEGRGVLTLADKLNQHLSHMSLNRTLLDMSDYQGACHPQALRR